MQAALDPLPQAILLIDIDLTVLFANHAARRKMPPKTREADQQPEKLDNKCRKIELKGERENDQRSTYGICQGKQRVLRRNPAKLK